MSLLHQFGCLQVKVYPHSFPSRQLVLPTKSAPVIPAWRSTYSQNMHDSKTVNCMYTNIILYFVILVIGLHVHKHIIIYIAILVNSNRIACTQIQSHISEYDTCVHEMVKSNYIYTD